MRDMDVSKAWLGDTTNRTIAAASDYKGDKLAACWFPNRELAEKWKEYMATGNIIDKTPPSAPHDLIANFWGTNLLVRWKAEADLESGIKTLIIYRDGKELKTLPKNDIIIL